MQRDDFNWLINELRSLTGDLGQLAGHDEPDLLLAIDQGGHASRAIVFDRSGRQVAEAFAPVSTYRSGNDRVEHVAMEVLDSIRTALGDVCQSLGTDTRRIAAAGLATQRSSIVCWDKRTHAALSPVLSWQDRRNPAALKAWQARETEVRRITGLPLSPHYGASKIRWCLDELPAVRDAAARGQLVAGPLASWLLQQLLAGQPAVADAANASRTLLWDIASGDWSPELLGLAGIPASVLPQSVATHHAFGMLPLGEHAVPLVVCTGDQSAVPFAHGRPDGHSLYLNIGTGAFLQCPVTHEPGRPTTLLRSVLLWDSSGARYSLEGTVNGAGSALSWLDDQTGLDDHRAALSLTRELAAGHAIPVFINGVSGVGSPYWIPQLQSRFLDDAPLDELAKVAAVVESIAFLVAANAAEMRQLEPGLTRIVAGGGLSQSDYLCGCIADLTGLVVERSSLREATATGLAFLVAGMPDDWSPVAEIERFVPTENPTLARRHERWQQAMRELST
ncbi:MAG: FGGY family carbohydrate kinase [Steroidobacteraceae bacterium]